MPQYVSWICTLLRVTLHLQCEWEVGWFVSHVLTTDSRMPEPSAFYFEPFAAHTARGRNQSTCVPSAVFLLGQTLVRAALVAVLLLVQLVSEVRDGLQQRGSDRRGPTDSCMFCEFTPFEITEHFALCSLVCSLT